MSNSKRKSPERLYPHFRRVRGVGLVKSEHIQTKQDVLDGLAFHLCDEDRARRWLKAMDKHLDLELIREAIPFLEVKLEELRSIGSGSPNPEGHISWVNNSFGRGFAVMGEHLKKRESVRGRLSHCLKRVM